jgi:MFS family permease
MCALRRFGYGRIVLATGFVVLFFSGGSRFAFGLMLKPMADDLGWSRSSLSLAVATFMVVSALALPIVGRLVDRYSIRWIIGAGAVFGAAGIGLMGGITEPWQLFVVYGFVYAIGNAGTSITPVSVMIGRWFVQRRGTANSVAISGNAIGQLVIITLLAASLTSISWRTAYIVLGAVNLAVVVPLVLGALRASPAPPGGNGPTPTAPTQSIAEGGTSPGTILASRQFWLLVIVYAVCGFQDFFVATHVVAFALDQSVGPVLAGNMLALMGLTGLVGVVASGLLADAFGAARPTALCFLMRIAIFASILYFQSTAGILAFALFYGFTFLITAPLTVVFAANIFGPARLGTVSGLISMVHQIAGGLGAFVGAVIFDRWGSYDGAFLLMLVLSLVAVTATLVVRDKPRAGISGLA